MMINTFDTQWFHLECDDDVSKWFLANGESVGDLVEKPNNQRFIVERPLKAFGANWMDGYKVRVRKVIIHFLMILTSKNIFKDRPNHIVNEF